MRGNLWRVYLAGLAGGTQAPASRPGTRVLPSAHGWPPGHDRRPAWLALTQPPGVPAGRPGGRAGAAADPRPAALIPGSRAPHRETQGTRARGLEAHTRGGAR